MSEAVRFEFRKSEGGDGYEVHEGGEWLGIVRRHGRKWVASSPWVKTDAFPTRREAAEYLDGPAR